MRSANRGWLLGALSVVALAAAGAALGQDDPKSLLPPGFGDPVEVPQKGSDSNSRPADTLPSGVPAPSTALPGGAIASTGDATDANGDALPEDEEDLDLIARMPDLPAGVRRSTARVGILAEEDGGLGAAAFGTTDGKYLSYLMRRTKAPIASRWTSILLRRALLSEVDTPKNLNGADWVAERAWLLLRMGEADAARSLVQSVDVDQYTPKMFQVAMQTYLANADPAGMCPMVEPAMTVSDEAGWSFARAMCTGLAGESAEAGALIDIARNKPAGRGIDGILAEKVVGAGGNTRRAVTVQWDNVPNINAWRFGLASATGVDIPENLLSKLPTRVLAWRARTPLVAVDKRTRDADIAAALGVYSSAALVDFYGQVADVTDPSAIGGTPADTLSKAYEGNDAGGKVDAMRSLWTAEALDGMGKYARLILTARAAARLKPDSDFDADLGSLVGSMMSAGLDIQAAKWSKVVADGSGDGADLAWALLAVGAPNRAVEWTSSRIGAFQGRGTDESGLRGRFLFAGMAGLGRMSAGEISSMAQDLEIPVSRQSAWTRALDRAVAGREQGTVALLSALALSVPDWRSVSPAELYHIVSSLRQVGLSAEARMIAAEAVTRT